MEKPFKKAASFSGPVDLLARAAEEIEVPLQDAQGFPDSEIDYLPPLKPGQASRIGRNGECIPISDEEMRRIQASLSCYSNFADDGQEELIDDYDKFVRDQEELDARNGSPKPGDWIDLETNDQSVPLSQVEEEVLLSASPRRGEKPKAAKLSSEAPKKSSSTSTSVAKEGVAFSAIEKFIPSSSSSKVVDPKGGPVKWTQVVAKKSVSSVVPEGLTPTSHSVSEAVAAARASGESSMQAKGLTVHKFPPLSDSQLDRCIAQAYGSGQEDCATRISIPEIIAEPSSVVNRSFTVCGYIKFVLLWKPFNSVKWVIPDIQYFYDVLNIVENHIAEFEVDAGGLLCQVSEWEGVGAFGLKIASPLRLDLWRQCLAKLRFADACWNSFPQDAVEITKHEVSILLKSKLRNFNLRHLCYGLLTANSKLRGRISARYSKVYGVNDKTLRGVSKDGWRLLFCEADTTFMNSLSDYPAGHSFSLGPSYVEIRGITGGPVARISASSVPSPPPPLVSSSSSSSLASFPGLATICDIKEPLPPSSLSWPASGPGSRGGRGAARRGRGRGRGATAGGGATRKPPKVKKKLSKTSFEVGDL